MVVIAMVIATVDITAAAERGGRPRPTWIKNPPRPLNSTYSFKVVESDAGNNLSSAREHSRKELTRSIAREFNLLVSDQLNSQSTTNYNGAEPIYSGKDVYELSIKSNDGNIRIYYERIDEYYEVEKVGDYEVFRLYTLYAIPRQGVQIPTFDNFQTTTKYGFSGAWRSVIIPGWGQFYKGSKAKGAIFLGGTAALAGGIIFAENKRIAYNRNIAESYNSELKRYYADKSSTMSNVRNICIGGAVALYIYNLIDAAVAPGAKRIKVTKSKMARSHFSVIPTLKQNMTGVALTYNF